ncbi:hypothetical protein, partial [Planomonospora algeriensis]
MVGDQVVQVAGDTGTLGHDRAPGADLLLGTEPGGQFPQARRVGVDAALGGAEQPGARRRRGDQHRLHG